jgi:hypothetical protein
LVKDDIPLNELVVVAMAIGEPITGKNLGYYSKTDTYLVLRDDNSSIQAFPAATVRPQLHVPKFNTREEADAWLDQHM